MTVIRISPQAQPNIALAWLRHRKMRDPGMKGGREVLINRKVGKWGKVGGMNKKRKEKGRGY